jgi:hypothetical protein
MVASRGGARIAKKWFRPRLRRSGIEVIVPEESWCGAPSARPIRPSQGVLPQDFLPQDFLHQDFLPLECADAFVHAGAFFSQCFLSLRFLIHCAFSPGFSNGPFHRALIASVARLVSAC